MVEKSRGPLWAFSGQSAFQSSQKTSASFNIDIGTCEARQGQVRVIACIEDPVVIKKILGHLKSNEEKVSGKLPQVRAPPVSVFTLVN